MDDPVTDVVFVTDPQNCPEGYTVLTECPCGHEAQLWEKVHGGKDYTRYLCFTKKHLSSNEDEDKVIESLYIPGAGVQYLMPYYEVIARTLEGDREPLRHKQLALKKVKRSEAKDVVADIVVARGKDSISKKFRKLEKINGVRICFRQEKYTPKPTPVKPTHTMDDMILDTRNLSIMDPRTRAQTVSPGPNARHTSPPPGCEFGQSNIPKPVYPSQSNSTTVDSTFQLQPLVEEVACMKIVENLASAPPPSIDPGQQYSHLPSWQQDSTGLQDVSPPTDQEVPPPTDQQNSPPPTDQQEELDGPPATSQPPFGNPLPNAPPVEPTHQQYYPAPTGPSGGFQNPGYQQPTGYQQSTGYHQPTGYHHHGYPQPGMYPSQPYAQPGGFPHAVPPPTTTVGYDTTIGFSLGGGVNTYTPPQPRYYPPQHAAPPGQYPPSFPQAPVTAPRQPSYPPTGPPNNTQTNIGFNL